MKNYYTDSSPNKTTPMYTRVISQYIKIHMSMKVISITVDWDPSLSKVLMGMTGDTVEGQRTVLPHPVTT